MKLERISKNQIRCTLNISDLDSRNIKLSELAYGSGKTRELFRDMMHQAYDELGFEVNNIPLMIEAVPVSSESIILIITKVEDPDDYARLSKKLNGVFGDTDTEDETDYDTLDEGDYDDVNDAHENEYLFTSREPDIPENSLAIYSFSSLNTIVNLTRSLPDNMDFRSSLYKSPDNGKYYLVISEQDETSTDTKKTIGILSEFGECEAASSAASAYYHEHFKHIITDNALQSLKKI